MGIHHACKALEELGLVSTKGQRKGVRTVQIKSVTRAGKKYLNEVRTERVKNAPVSVCEFYVLDNVKNDPFVHEDVVCLLTRKRSKATTDIAKEWYDNAINRYSKTL